MICKVLYQNRQLQCYLKETREIRKLLNIQTRKHLLFNVPHDPQKPIFNPKLPLMRYFSILKQHCWKVCHGHECSLLNYENDPLKTQAMLITWQQGTLWDLSLWGFGIQTAKLLGCLNIWCYRQMLQEQVFILCSWCSSTDSTHSFTSWAVCLHISWGSQKLVEKVTSTCKQSYLLLISLGTESETTGKALCPYHHLLMNPLCRFFSLVRLIFHIYLFSHLVHTQNGNEITLKIFCIFNSSQGVYYLTRD